MASLVQANSLSNITTIAAEPPARLNTQDAGHEPLTLYIARVPGSQDVFLTTMKPREKVVTAQDVESSLYYCHLDSDKDNAVRDSLQSRDGVQTMLDEKKHYSILPPDQSIGTVKRKSVPQTPQLESTRSESPPKVFAQFQQPGFQKPLGSRIERKPVVGLPPMPSRPSEGSVSPSRKPLGPRPQENVPPTSYQSHALAHPGQENLRPLRHRDVAPPLPARTNSDLSTSAYDEERNGRPPLPLRRTSTTFSDVSENFSLTLIRRDPTSGDQWNIGKITKDGLLSASSLLGDAATAEAIRLEINTPGYDKFVPQQPSDGNTPLSHAPFERKLQTQRQKSEPSSSRKSMFRSSVDLSQRDLELSAKNGPYLSPNPQENSPPDLCFLSPWNGICEFSTGASGRTLKCRHSPPAAANDINPTLRRLNSAPISELRLNLPVISSSKRPPLSASHSRTSFFQGHGGHRHSVSADGSRHSHDERDEWDDAEEQRMDLSLGQEHAGGGFGGKKAKLAKLIVEGEGLQMLDLVVAANMGFWWSLKNQRR